MNLNTLIVIKVLHENILPLRVPDVPDKIATYFAA